MESLLPELAARVAKYLTPQELTACCGVSVHWRDVFGTNEIWKKLCDLKMEEHLRRTPCIVEPVLSVSPDENSTLAPLGRWRLAFLREQHLWKNWQEGNFKTVDHKVKEVKQSLERFITNDFIVSFNMERLGLWDVRPVPPIRVDSFDFGREVHYSPTVFGSFVVLRNNLINSIQVIKVDVIKGTILLKYIFQFNEISQTPELVCSNTPVFSGALSLMRSFELIIIKDKFCIGYFQLEISNNSFHIWDLESGIKLKKESLRADSLCVVGCQTCACDDVLVLVPSSVDLQTSPPIFHLQCQVYNVQNLSFWPFSQTCSVFQPSAMIFARDFDQCAITNNFVALTDCEDNTIRIFNYRTGQQMYKLEANSGVQVLADACFMFTYQKSLPTEEQEEEVRLCLVFCASADVVKDVTGFDVEHFQVVGDKLVEVVSFNGDYEVWVMNRFAPFKTDIHFPEFKEVNQACTKLITEKTEEEIDMIQISHFW